MQMLWGGQYMRFQRTKDPCKTIIELFNSTEGMYTAAYIYFSSGTFPKQEERSHNIRNVLNQKTQRSLRAHDNVRRKANLAWVRRFYSYRIHNLPLSVAIICVIRCWPIIHPTEIHRQWIGLLDARFTIWNQTVPILVSFGADNSQWTIDVGWTSDSIPWYNSNLNTYPFFTLATVETWSSFYLPHNWQILLE